MNSILRRTLRNRKGSLTQYERRVILDAARRRSMSEEIERTLDVLQSLMTRDPFISHPGVLGTIDALDAFSSGMGIGVYLRGWVYVPGEVVETVNVQLTPKSGVIRLLPAEPRPDVLDAFRFDPRSLYTGFEGSFHLSEHFPSSEAITADLVLKGGKRIRAVLPTALPRDECGKAILTTATEILSVLPSELFSIVVDGRIDPIGAISAAKEIRGMSGFRCEFFVVSNSAESDTSTNADHGVRFVPMPAETSPTQVLCSLVGEFSGTVALYVGPSLSLRREAFEHLAKMLSTPSCAGVCGPVFDEAGEVIFPLSPRFADSVATPECPCGYRYARMLPSLSGTLLAVRPEHLLSRGINAGLSPVFRYDPAFSAIAALEERELLHFTSSSFNVAVKAERSTALIFFDSMPQKERSLLQASRERFVSALLDGGVHVRIFAEGRTPNEWRRSPFFEHIPAESCSKHVEALVSSSDAIVVSESIFRRIQEHYLGAFMHHGRPQWLLEVDGLQRTDLRVPRLGWTLRSAPSGAEIYKIDILGEYKEIRDAFFRIIENSRRAPVDKFARTL